jgi:predicted metal-dependent hydrolase
MDQIIEPDGTILIKAPYLVPRFLINQFVAKHQDWIQKKQQILALRQKTEKAGEYLYLGKYYPLELRQNQKELIELEDKFYLGSLNKKYVKTYLTSWYKQQARKVISERVYYYAKMAGLNFRTIHLTSAQTRWGSCSSEKNLNFNWKLIMAPLPVIDYVVAHELAHLTQMNHSKDFWETVRKMYPLYREHRTWIKRYGHTLHI